MSLRHPVQPRCAMTHSHVRHDSFVCAMTRSYVCHDPLKCDVTHAYLQPIPNVTASNNYGVATVSRIDKIIGLFCRISSL